MKNMSFPKKKIGFDNSFELTKCLQQIEIPVLLHICAYGIEQPSYIKTMKQHIWPFLYSKLQYKLGQYFLMTYSKIQKKNYLMLFPLSNASTTAISLECFCTWRAMLYRCLDLSYPLNKSMYTEQINPQWLHGKQQQHIHWTNQCTMVTW